MGKPAPFLFLLEVNNQKVRHAGFISASSLSVWFGFNVRG
ncbi:hypothetical protein JCM19233_2868 [Vibrio astriarenae]|nr:hypothetical protein JCM19233_2868 [Vibrio sp. C7]